MTINNEAARSRPCLAEKDRIATANLERARAQPRALHQLLDRFRHSAHACAARSHRRHATHSLQALGKRARLTINVTVETCERHKSREW